MNRILIIIVAFVALSFAAKAQTATATAKPIRPTDTTKLYHPNADAKADIAAAVKRAAGKKCAAANWG
ncbi:hypothetical protein [Mucilaginibacter antarcticus]|uniref:hypothetical protein n=1 Tax=Mucilaginibacter antarcticus TaxID=1855725 RepID=UPI00362DAD3B